MNARRPGCPRCGSARFWAFGSLAHCPDCELGAVRTATPRRTFLPRATPAGTLPRGEARHDPLLEEGDPIEVDDDEDDE